MAYSTAADLKRFLPKSVIFEGDNPTPDARNPNPESLETADADFYIASADDVINGKINAIFDVPLRKVNIGGVIAYPPPIPVISAMLAAHMIFQERLSGSEKVEGEFTKRYYIMAMERLDNIANGNIRLSNQNAFTSHRTIKADLFTRPPNPSVEVAADGKS